MRGPQHRTVHPLNDGKALSVVRLPGSKLGVLDEGNGKGMVWVEYAMASVRVEAYGTIVALPIIPACYGVWHKTSIGGVSSTVRRNGILRTAPNSHGAVVMFAIHTTDEIAAKRVFAGSDRVTIGNAEFVESHGFVTEVVVHRADDVAWASATLARAGAVPILENGNNSMRRSIGIERLDRIDAKAVIDESMMLDANDGQYGLRRGSENWRFSWIPSEWKDVPITWDHVVENVRHEKIETIPQPLRQHVARARLNDGDYPAMGSEWCRTTAPSQHVIRWNAAHNDTYHVPFDIFFRIVTLPESEQLKIVEGRTDVHAPGVDAHTLTQIDGEWFRCHDSRNFLERHVPMRGRWVSPKLTGEQSKQLISAFYHLEVERTTDDDEVTHALKLIMFHYMKERGYMARWLGRYEQDAEHVGNSKTFRSFQNMPQYAAHRLPTDVLNRLCDRTGVLRNRGSKGTRSKYKQSGSSTTPHYIPKCRQRRTKDHEDRMRG